MIQASPGRSRLSAKVIALLTVAAALIMSMVPGRALAEAPSVKSVPAPGVLETSTGAPPPTVRLAFSERLNPRGSSLTVLNVPGFEQVDLGNSQLDPSDPKTMVVSLKPELGTGKYPVKWTSVFVEDGSELSAKYGFVTFRTGEAPTPVEDPEKAAPENPEQTASPTSGRQELYCPPLEDLMSNPSCYSSYSRLSPCLEADWPSPIIGREPLSNPGIDRVAADFPVTFQ